MGAIQHAPDKRGEQHDGVVDAKRQQHGGGRVEDAILHPQPDTGGDGGGAGDHGAGEGDKGHIGNTGIGIMFKEDAPPKRIQADPEYDCAAGQPKGIEVYAKDRPQQEIPHDHGPEQNADCHEAGLGGQGVEAFVARARHQGGENRDLADGVDQGQKIERIDSDRLQFIHGCSYFALPRITFKMDPLSLDNEPMKYVLLVLSEGKIKLKMILRIMSIDLIDMIA